MTGSAIHFPAADTRAAIPAATEHPAPLGFALLILVTAALFVRPGEIIAPVQGWPIYELLILAAFAVALPAVVRILRPASLRRNPITVLVLALLPAMTAAPLLGGGMAEAADNAFEFSKALLYYLLLVALLDSPLRIRRFGQWLLAFTIGLALLPLLHHHGILHVSALRTVQEWMASETGVTALRRLVGAGLFSDPNDLAHILNVGVALCLFAMASNRSRLARVGWAAVLLLFGHVIYLTHSRGGFIALAATVLTLMYMHFGLRKALLLGVMTLPLLAFLFAGRQTELSTSSGTGQTRIQLWSDALVAFREAPLFGIGRGSFARINVLVVHNSFLHSFVELGIAGGTLFLGAWILALRGLHRLGRGSVRIADDHLRRFRPYLVAALIAYAVGMLFLSRSYVVPTYLMLGLAAAYLRVVPTSPPQNTECLSGTLAVKLLLAGVLFIVAMHVFVRLTLRW